MRRLWIVLGRSAYWLLWPVLFVWLYFTKRNRVLVVVDDEILAVKGWLGNGQWSLPGGGVHIGEAPEASAVRELQEETGIVASKRHLQPLLNTRARGDNGLKYSYYAFGLELQKKPSLRRRKSELTHVEWIQWHELYEDPRTSSDVKDIISAWRNR